MKARNTLTLDRFRGVDLSSSPLEVAGNRATDARNLICENGVNHKRHGFEELLALEGRINGIFPFREEGGTEILLVHAGAALWRVVKENGEWKKDQIPVKNKGGEIIKGEDGSTILLADQRSQCFCRDGVAFLIGCGEYLAYGKHNGETYTLVPVSEIAYVPTTTINIEEVHERFYGNDTGRAQLDGVNMITPWRRNELLIPDRDVDFDGNAYTGLRFELDGLVDNGTEAVITFNEGNTVTFEFPNYGGKNVSFSLKGKLCSFWIYVENYGVFNCAELIITFSSDVWKSLRGGTITVRFSSTVEEYREKINACRFGTTFGVSGASDRLFLSGNPEYPNKDFFSEAEDFTYFPDGNVLTVGDALSPVTGYARLSDATLAVFKGESMDDASIYFRTGEERTITDTDGHEVPGAFFPTVAGTAGEYLVGAHTVANLLGDVLMLSKNGVFGIELSANVSSTERYARERSRAIFEDLKRRGVTEDAASIVFRGRYYLALGDEEGTCYIADSRYKATFEGTTDVGYEWWVWKDVPARTFAVYDDEMIFGTTNGRLCRFGEGFADVTYSVIDSGAVMQSSEDPAALVADDALRVKDGDRVVLDGALFGLLLDQCKVENGLVCLPDDEEQLKVLAKRLFDGAEVYADNVGGSGLAAHAPYVVTAFDIGALTFQLKNEDGNVVPLTDGGFRLSRRLTGVECRIKTVEKETMLADAAGDVWTLVNYNGATASAFTGRLTHYTPVVAEWHTPVIDFGTAATRKTLLGMTLALGEETTGLIEYGYDTRRGSSERRVVVGTPFDFATLDFGRFTFSGKRYTCSYTKRLCLRNFNYLRLFWRSADDVDCVINGVSVVYKMGQMNRGLY